jgi:hypothetical protein
MSGAVSSNAVKEASELTYLHPSPQSKGAVNPRRGQQQLFPRVQWFSVASDIIGLLGWRTRPLAKLWTLVMLASYQSSCSRFTVLSLFLHHQLPSAGISILS